MSTVIIRPKTLAGTIAPPPSKSQAHRLIISAALARGTSTIRNVAFSQDIEATLRCMEALGASWEQPEEGAVRVTGIGGSTPHSSTKREPGEHYTDDLCSRRSVRLGLSAMCGEMKKEAAMQGIPCVAASFCLTPMF